MVLLGILAASSAANMPNTLRACQELRVGRLEERIGDYALIDIADDENGVYQDVSASVQAQDHDHGRSDTDEIRPKLSYIERVLLKTP